MILASRNGNMCAVTSVRETPAAWHVTYVGEIKPVRVPKSSGRMLFKNTQDAEKWIYGVDSEPDYT